MTATGAAPAPRPRVFFGTPRKLPKPSSLPGRVVVLDIAFAAEGTGASFDKVTAPFIAGLGDRLAMWIDHHDHDLHERYVTDPRFVLARKRDHGACPEMVTEAIVQRVGVVESVVCHNDLDGLYSAAKWLRGGREPYEGADADARVVDTCTGTASPLGNTLDHALRAEPKNDDLRARIVAFLADGARDAAARNDFEQTARGFAERAENARTLAAGYERRGALAIVDASGFVQRVGTFDKTEALLLGQKLAPVAVVFDESTVTLAAAFESGIDLIKLLSLPGGMPTRVSVPRARLADVLALADRIPHTA